MNMASLWKLPVLFVCENNLYAIGTAIQRSTTVTDQYQRLSAYNIPASQHPGQDVEMVMEAARSAVTHVRSGAGPYFLEFLTYRYRGHSMSDAGAYRSKEEVARWMQQDPIQILAKRLLEAGELTKEEFKAMEQAVQDEIDSDIVKFAEQSPEPKVEELTKYVREDNPDPRWIGPLQAQGGSHG
jgi:pyruvate dehydrogenase E1 component alpha subunit